MTVRELINGLEEYGDHLEVRIVIEGPMRDRVCALLDMTLDTQEGFVAILAEEA